MSHNWSERVTEVLWLTLQDSLYAWQLPTKRVFWPFLAGAALLSALVWFRHVRGHCSLRQFLFPKDIWLHPSARLDYQLWIVRPLVQALILLPIALSVRELSFLLARWLWRTVGIWPPIELSKTWIMLLLSVSVFVAEDLARYVVHRLAHQVPVLWELHKVHHSAEVLTPFTVYRTHPLESILMRSGAALAVAVVSGLFIWVFPGRIHGLEIMGTWALSFVWNLLGSNLRHSHVWLSFGPVLERWLISPAQHQIHHSQDPHQHHKNYGSALAIWDRLGGSLYVTQGRERLRFGLPPETRNHELNVWSVLVSPLRAAVKRTPPESRS